MAGELLHGAPCRFTDPARFSFAHGGKDGHPYPVPIRVYDATIRVMTDAVESAKLDKDDKLAALRTLSDQARVLEQAAKGPPVEDFIARERAMSHRLGGRTAQGPARPRQPKRQLVLPGIA
jgi:hypothetical protein